MADTETPVTTPDPTPEATPAPKEPAVNADTGTTSAAAPAATAPVVPAKPAVNVDDLIEAAARAQSEAAERIRAAEAKEHALKTKYGRYEEIDEPLAKADTPEAKQAALKQAIKQLAGEGYNPSEIIQILAEDVEIPLEQIDPSDLPKKIPEMISKEVSRIERERLAREAAAAKEAADKKAAEDKAAAEQKAKDDAAVQEQYFTELSTDLTTKHADKFPLCNAWIHRITEDKVIAVARGFAKVNDRAPNADELFPAIEAEFAAELAKATGRVAVPAQTTTTTAAQASTDLAAEIERELEEMDNKRRAQVMKKDPTVPTGAPVAHAETGGNVLDDILKQLEREDASRAGRLSY